jgi:hypothetical protein
MIPVVSAILDNKFIRIKKRYITRYVEKPIQIANLLLLHCG